MICDDKYACSTILQQAGIPHVKCKFFDILHSDRQTMIYEIFEYLDISLQSHGLLGLFCIISIVIFGFLDTHHQCHSS